MKGKKERGLPSIHMSACVRTCPKEDVLLKILDKPSKTSGDDDRSQG